MPTITQIKMVEIKLEINKRVLIVIFLGLLDYCYIIRVYLI